MTHTFFRWFPEAGHQQVKGFTFAISAHSGLGNCSKSYLKEFAEDTVDF